MYEINYIPITDHLSQEDTTKHELFKLAASGKIELLIYLQDIVGRLVGKDNHLAKEMQLSFKKYQARFNKAELCDQIIVTEALFKITQRQCKQLMLNNVSEILINSPLGLYEGKFKFQVGSIRTSLDYINIEVCQPKENEKNCRLFNPCVFKNIDDILAFGFYNLKLFSHSPCDTYCYAVPIEKILMLKNEDKTCLK